MYTFTHTKTKFEYLNPRPETVLIEDIAHALSQICRFTGHTSRFFSVAQHSVLVSNFVSKENALWGLLHDAPEAYVNDVSSPLKKLINGNYEVIHDHIMSIICQKFGLAKKEPAEVKIIDRMVTVNELWTFIDNTYQEEGIRPLWNNLKAWSSVMAKEEFLKRFKELTTRSKKW